MNLPEFLLNILNIFLGSFHNSQRNIEQELIKIVQNNTILDELTSHTDQNQHLRESLEMLKSKDSVGSLSIYDKYSDEDYQTFRLLSTNILKEGATFGDEPFPGSLLGPSNK